MQFMDSPIKITGEDHCTALFSAGSPSIDGRKARRGRSLILYKLMTLDVFLMSILLRLGTLFRLDRKVT